MKGLLIKDIRLLKNQGRTLFILLALMIAITFAMSGSSSMPCTCIIFILSILGLNTISYDEYDNGLSFLFVLPVTKKQYVHEKYLFTLGVLVCSAAAGLLISMALWALGGREDSLREIFITCGICAAATAVFLSVAFPLKFKFEGEKGRMIIPVVFGLGGVIIIFLAQQAEKLPAGVRQNLYLAAQKLGTGGVIAVIAGVIILLFSVSWLVSLRIIENREV